MIASISYEFILVDCICFTNISLCVDNLCCFIIDNRNACGINFTSMQCGGRCSTQSFFISPCPGPY